MGQALGEVLGVAHRDHRVASAGDDLHRGLDPGQQVLEQREIDRVVANEPRGLSEAAPGVRVHVVLQRGRGDLVALVRCHRLPDDLGAVEREQRLEVGVGDQIREVAADLERIGGRSVSDHHARQRARRFGRGEQRRRPADVGAEDVRGVQLPLVDQADEEAAHGLRRVEVDAALRLPEAGKVDRDHVPGRAEPRPQLLPGVEALGPRAQEQQRQLAVGIGLGEADLDSARLPRLRGDHLGHAAPRKASTSAANSAWCWNRKPCAESG